MKRIFQLALAAAASLATLCPSKAAHFDCLLLAVGEITETGPSCNMGPLESVVAIASVLYGKDLVVPPRVFREALYEGTVFDLHCYINYAPVNGADPADPRVYTWRIRTGEGKIIKEFRTSLGIDTITTSIRLADVEDRKLVAEFLDLGDNLLGKINIRVDGDCKSCSNGSCRSKADVGSVDFTVPVGSAQATGSFTGRPVSLQFFQESVVNQGISQLKVLSPVDQPGVTVVEGGGGDVESVQVGDFIARVDLLGEDAVDSLPASDDPMRFRVRVSSDATDPDASVFKTVVVETVEGAGGDPELTLTETLNGQTSVTIYRNPVPGEWTVETGGGLRRETHIDTENATTRTKRILIEELIPGTPSVYQKVSDVLETSAKFDWGWDITSTVIDPDGEALATTTTYYLAGEDSSPDVSGNGEAEGRIKTRTSPTGDVERHYYFEPGEEDFFDSAHLIRMAFAGTEDGREILITSSSGVSPTSGLPVTVTVSEESAGGHIISKTESLEEDLGMGTTLVEQRVLSSSGASTSTYTINGADGTRIEVKPDMTVSTSSRSVDPSDGESVLSETIGWVSNFSNKSNPTILVRTAAETKSNHVGEIIGRTKRHYRPNGSSETTEQMTAADYDPFDRVTRYLYLSDTAAGGTLEATREYDCCGLAKEVDRFGVATYFVNDSLGRQIKINSLGVTTETSYQGLATSSHRYPEALIAGSLPKASQASLANEISRQVSDLRGELVEEWARTGSDAVLRKTTIKTEFNLGSGIGRRVTTTPPQTSEENTQGIAPTRTSEYFLDGSIAKEGGNLGPAISYSYETDSTGLVSMRSFIDGSDLRETVATHSDWAGRTARIVFASDADGDSQLDSSEYSYNSMGQLVRETDPDGMTRLFGYNIFGERTTTATDLNGNGAINLGVDQVTVTERSLHSTDPKFETITKAWKEGQTSAFLGVVVSLVRESFDGLVREQTDYPDDLTRITKVTKAHVSAGEWTVTTQYPDGRREVESHVGGMLAETSLSDSSNTQLYSISFGYDGMNRLQTSTDSRTGTTTLVYADPLLDLVETNEDPDGNLVINSYDERNRLTKVNMPDTLNQSGGTLVNESATSYFPGGQVREVVGGQEYRRSYTYDYAGRVETLTTYGTETAVTRWLYDSSRGWLIGKRYNSPTHGTGSGPNYSYTAAGRIKTLTQARLVEGSPLVTTYQYGVATNSTPALLDSVSYSDGTPGYAVSERDLFGRPTEIADGVAGNRSISYYDYGPSSFSGVSGAGLHSGLSVFNGYDTMGRLANISHLHSSGFSQNVDYRYDAAGRFSKVKAHGVTADYYFSPTRQLVSQLTLSERKSVDPFGGFGDEGVTSKPVVQNTRHHDSLGRLERTTWHSVSTGGEPKPLSHWAYSYNGLGQRTTSMDLAGDSWRFGYGSAGEVTKADKLKAGGGTTFPGRQFRYAYDGVGNRTGVESGGNSSGGGRRTIGYTPDALNQYDAITHPGSFDVTGNAPASSTPTVGTEQAEELGTYFRKEVSVTNTSGPIWKDVEVSDGIQTVEGSYFVPASSTAPDYDEDGNLQADGQWSYTWDAKNRLVGVERTAAALSAGAPYVKLQYSYDYLDRRIAERRYDSPAATVPDWEKIWLYDGWNCIAEFDGAWSLRQEYIWGRDLSGSLQGAGGAGGLLWIRDGTSDKVHFCAYDGNGNVTNLIAEDGESLTAVYEYSPFGEVLRSTGSYAASNPFRFSSRYQDGETGLYYYGYRYYDSGLGRWLSRDSISEQGGLNLYGFVENRPLHYIDYLGNAPKVGDQMSPDVFMDLPNTDRISWAESFRARFGAHIDKAARENCVPKRILATVIANEMLDWEFPDGNEFDGIRGGGVGAAQIAPKTAVTEGVHGFDVNSPGYQSGYRQAFANSAAGLTPPQYLEQVVHRSLLRDDYSVTVAARLVRKYLQDLCIGQGSGTFGNGFVREFMPKNKDFGGICCQPCNTIIDAPISDTLARLVTAKWNNPLVTTAKDTIDDSNYHNSLRNSLWAIQNVTPLIDLMINK